MKIITILIAFLSLNLSIAQSNTDSICNLQIENSNWKLSLEKVQNKPEKISLIKQKILSDSIYSDYKPGIVTHEIIYKAVDKLGNDCGCKILFLLTYSKKKSVALNLSENPKLKSVVENLDAFNVDEVFTIFDQRAESLYGTNGKCGVVILKTKNKKLIQLIKKAVI